MSTQAAKNAAECGISLKSLGMKGKKMGTIITWIIVFAILCGCIFAWVYMCHRGPHANENSTSDSCNGDCLHCASNTMHNLSRTPETCDVPRPASTEASAAESTGNPASEGTSKS
ncbi:MAG: hypothetical protein IKQ97_02220 [Eubacterium sp.]|nr:hypothetical protein [Eubacterium sp.]